MFWSERIQLPHQGGERGQKLKGQEGTGRQGREGKDPGGGLVKAEGRERLRYVSHAVVQRGTPQLVPVPKGGHSIRMKLTQLLRSVFGLTSSITSDMWDVIQGCGCSLQPYSTSYITP